MARATPEELRTEILAYAKDMTEVSRWGVFPYADWYRRLCRAAGGFGDSPLETTLTELLRRVSQQVGCLFDERHPIDIPADLLTKLRDHEVGPADDLENGTSTVPTLR